MNKFDQLVVWTLDDQRYALPLSAVIRIVRLVEISPLPKAPAIILGVINMQGRIMPVVNIRQRFRMSDREVCLSDQLIIASTSNLTVGVIADTVTGVIELPSSAVSAAEQIFPGLGYVAGVAKLEDGIVLIHD